MPGTERKRDRKIKDGNFGFKAQGNFVTLNHNYSQNRFGDPHYASKYSFAVPSNSPCCLVIALPADINSAYGAQGPIS